MLTDCSIKTKALSITTYVMLLAGLELFGFIMFSIKDSEIHRSVVYLTMVVIYAMYWPIFVLMSREWCISFPLMGSGITVHGLTVLMITLSHFVGELYLAFYYSSVILGTVIDLLSFVWIYYFLLSKHGAVHH